MFPPVHTISQQLNHIPISWHKGTVYHEKKALEIQAQSDSAPEARLKAEQTIENIKMIKTNRHWGQPWVRSYYPTTSMEPDIVSLSARILCVCHVYRRLIHEWLVSSDLATLQDQ